MAMALQANDLPSCSGPGTSITHPHTLNKVNQITKLIENSSKPDIEIVVNCGEENVNIKCSPGFYNLVAKPTLLGISTNHQFSYSGVTFELKAVNNQNDQSGIIQSTILKFILQKN